jgi:hypothetical protein
MAFASCFLILNLLLQSCLVLCHTGPEYTSQSGSYKPSPYKIVVESQASYMLVMALKSKASIPYTLWEDLCVIQELQKGKLFCSASA